MNAGFPLPLIKLLQEPPRNIRSFNQIHALLLTSGLSTDLSVLAAAASSLAAAAASPDTAYCTLKQIHHHPTPYLFTTLISRYAGSNHPRSALLVYKHMAADGIPPDKYTFPVILKSCAKFSGIREARQLHSAAVKAGFFGRIYVHNALLYVYAMCGECEDAGYLFDDMPVRDVVSWTGLISGLIKAGAYGKALGLFSSMNVKPNGATLVSALVACGKLGDLGVGRRIHGLILKCSPEMVSVMLLNAVLDMYVKCERMDEARRVFEELSDQRDVFSWTSMITGFVHCKCPRDAVEIFHAMQASGVEPDKVVLSSVLSACASLGALDSGRWVHEYIERNDIERDVHIGTALVDMYAKCGCVDIAVSTFSEMPRKNVSSWNALLGGLAINGLGEDALVHFNQMVRNGFVPNDVTFIAILSACSHSGLVEQGRHYFKSMTEFYNLIPRIEHYGCMVDLLGRSGLLAEAHELISTMPMRADVFIWGSMLSACKAQGNVELSQQILGKLREVEPSDSGVYVLLSNIFAANDRWGDVTRIRKLMREKGIKKGPGSSVIEVNGKTHEFLVGEKDHPQVEDISLILNILTKQMQLDG